MKTALLLSASLGLCLVARAESPDSIPNPRATNNFSVYDGAHVLSDAEKRRIDTAISSLETRTKAQMLVVTVQTLDGMSIEEWANTLFRRIGVGRKGKDDGALFVFAIQDRKSRLEVGLGLEDRITDARATAILREQIAPAFRRGAYGEGILDGVGVAANYIAGGTRPAPRPDTEGSSSSGSTSSSQPPSSSNSFPSTNSSPRVYYPPNTSPSFPGGLLVLGVLAVGGIGAIVYMGTRPRRCPRCNNTLNITQAPENELSDAQQWESNLGARSFQKLTCPACGFSEVEGKDTYSQFTRCRTCGNRTARIQKRTLSQPSYSSEGLEQVTETCEYPPCRHVERRERSLPRLRRASSVSSGGFGGGFSSGSSSGSSSSSSSSGGSSSSSYGGGDSGGGGGSSSW